MMQLAEFYFLEPSKIISIKNGCMHARITIEGKSYDLFLPYDKNAAKIMRKGKYIATESVQNGKERSLHLLPGYIPQVTIKMMGYDKINAKYGKKLVIYNDIDVFHL